MKLLQAVMLETLRRYPVVPILPRGVVKSFTFAGRQLQAGMPVIVATGVAHCDPTL